MKGVAGVTVGVEVTPVAAEVKRGVAVAMIHEDTVVAVVHEDPALTVGVEGGATVTVGMKRGGR